MDGLRYRCTTGLDVDQQRITVSARPSDTVGGVPFFVALREGVFDGCTVRRDRAFLTAWDAPPIGGVTLFTGRLASVDQVGRTSATLTVASELTLLDVDLPRNVWQPTCNHTLYDTGCRLVRQAYASAGAVGDGASTTFIPWAGASEALTQGTVTFTSGGNSGVSATIKLADAAGLTLTYPLPAMPAPGDSFTAYQGCDHTLATCRSKFANEANFRGFRSCRRPRLRSDGQNRPLDRPVATQPGLWEERLRFSKAVVRRPPRKLGSGWEPDPNILPARRPQFRRSDRV